MGVAEAIVISSLISAGAGVAASALNKPDKAKTPQIGQTDARIAKKKDQEVKGARSALVVGSPTGVLSTPSTTGRGTLLGN